MKSPATSVQGVWVRFINIAAIHGFEESSGRHFLVMELATGETLADRIMRGPIPVGEANDAFPGLPRKSQEV